MYYHIKNQIQEWKENFFIIFATIYLLTVQVPYNFQVHVVQKHAFRQIDI